MKTHQCLDTPSESYAFVKVGSLLSRTIFMHRLMTVSFEVGFVWSYKVGCIRNQVPKHSLRYAL